MPRKKATREDITVASSKQDGEWVAVARRNLNNPDLRIKALRRAATKDQAEQDAYAAALVQVDAAESGEEFEPYDEQPHGKK
jgi:hypothetical protein